MRWIMLIGIGFILFSGVFTEMETEEETSLILEVEGSSTQAEKTIEVYHPFVEVVAVYDKLFQGVAVKGKPKHIEKVAQTDFVSTIHPVRTYKAMKLDESQENTPLENMTIPAEINPTSYTGKGVKVAVIDTGIDDSHPDLTENVKGGFDLVDLDDDPQETSEEEGEPTMHGTHVSGIIAANGELEGVAPDSDLYVYRALGPGGSGTSIQVIAAMEEAVEEGVDVMNLSLGNTFNGPDYPTSKAVDEASKQGIAVVIANGNDGPDNWTAGAPATAKTALSVGAYQGETEQLFLTEPKFNKQIPIIPLPFSMPWELNRDDEITEEADDSQGKLGMITSGKGSIAKKARVFQDSGAKGLLLEAEDVPPGRLEHLEEAADKIPIAIISRKDRTFIQKQISQEKTYFKYETNKQSPMLAPFSSHGPVSVNWMIKPDIIAPGVNILSTVPDGYEALSGTSMAAPHMAGAVAVLKEAHPNWSSKQIFGALRTTAKKMSDVEPIAQGTGVVQIEEAIDTDIIIENPLLSFGKTGKRFNEREVTISIENISKKDKTFRFDIPKKEKGITWELPQQFIIKAGEKKNIPVALSISASQVKEDMLQGWLELEATDETFSLPYLIVQKSADYPRIMDFSFQMDTNDKGEYLYELYVAENVKSVELQLYNPDTLTYEGTLEKWRDVEMGKHEGVLKKRNITQQGYYNGLLVVLDEQNHYHQYETDVFIE